MMWRMARAVPLVLIVAVAEIAVAGTRAHTGSVVNVDLLSIDLDSRFDYQDAAVEREFRTSESWSRTFTSGLKFGSAGSLYHPRLLTYQGSVRFAISRLDRGGTGADIDRNGSLDDYDFTARLFPEGSLSAFYTARRSRNRQRSRGLGDQDFTRDLQRVQVNYRNRLMPIQARWSWEDFSTEGLFESQESRDNFSIEGGRSYTSGLTRITYGNEDYQNYATAVQTHTERLDLQQNVVMGQRAQLSAALYWLEQDVFGRRVNKRATSNLRMFFPANVSTMTRTSVYRIEEPTGTTERLEAEMSVDHELYESLDTRLWAYGFREDNPDGRVERRDLLASLRYRKRVPFGKIRYGFSLKDVRQDNDLEMAERSVFDAPFTFPMDDRIALPESDIIVESIRIVDEAGVVPFVPSVDYTVEVIGRQVNILRVPTGQIPRNATVLVSYRFLVEGGGTGGYRDYQHRVGVDLPAGIQVDYARGVTDPRHLSGNQQEGVFSGDLHRWDVRWQRSVFDLHYRNEDEVLNGRRNEEERAEAAVRSRTSSGIALIARGMIGWTRYDNGPRLTFRNVMFSTQWSRSRGFSVGADTYFGWEELDSGDRNTAELNLRGEFRYGPNLLRGRVQYVRSNADALGLQEDTGIRVEFERSIR